MTQVLPPWLRSTRVVTGLLDRALIGLCALFAPLIAPHDPNEQNLLTTLLPPAWVEGGDSAFLLGTDSLGRDVLSRLIYGARVAMTRRDGGVVRRHVDRRGARLSRRLFRRPC